MRIRLAVILAASLLAAILVGVAPGAETPQAPQPAEAAKPALPQEVQNELQEMFSQCQMTDEQKTKVTQIATAGMASLAEWNKAHADQMAALQKQMKAASDVKDAAAAQKIRAEAIAVLEERSSIAVKMQQDMLAVMTPEQRLKWNGFVVSQQVKGRFAATQWTAEQAAKIQEMCDAAAKEITAITVEGIEGARAKGAVLGKLLVAVVNTVMTPEQRAALPQPPGAAVAPAPAPAPSPAPTK
jgi:Spy/CpxP family protein refolding chaperone